MPSLGTKLSIQLHCQEKAGEMLSCSLISLSLIPGLEIKALFCCMAPKAWKLTCSLDLSNLHPSHLRRGWPMDFSWHKVHFELSKIQEGRCKDSLSFYFASNAKTLMHLSVKQRAEQEGRQLALPILSFRSP